MEGSAAHSIRSRGASGAPPRGGSEARGQRTHCGWLALALALSAFTYFPITRNFFNGDDFFHLYRIVNKQLLEVLLFMHGGHLLIARNAIFMLFFDAFGTNAAAYFWLVLATHLFNVFLLFRVIRDLSDSVRLASFGAALWGILPVQEGSLGWYSVYGHVLVATCMLLVLSGMARATSGRPSSALAPVLWTLLLLVGAASFGVGIGVAWAMPLVALFLMPASPLRNRTLFAFFALALFLPILYLGSERLYCALYGGMPRSGPLIVSMQYWRLYIAFLAQLIGYGISCVVLGVFHRVLLYPGPAAYTVVATYAVVVLAILVRGSAAIRRGILACLVLCVGAYAIVAAGRGGFTGRFGAGSMAQMGRFHYVGTAALVLATCVALAQIAQWWPWKPAVATAVLLVWTGLTVIGQRALGVPIEHFDAARRETAWVLGQIRTAARSAPTASDVYIENQTFGSVGLMLGVSREGFPGWAALSTIYFPDGVVDGRRIRFVDAASVLEAVRDDRRTAALLVAAQDAPTDVYHPPLPSRSDRPTR